MSTELCQNCVWKLKGRAHMLTGYCIRGCKCKCGRFADLAIVIVKPEKERG